MRGENKEEHHARGNHHRRLPWSRARAGPVSFATTVGISSSTPATGAALSAAAAELAGSRLRARRSRATSPTPTTAPRSSAAAVELGGIDLLVNNASVLGPSPQPAARRLPPRRARPRVRGQHDRPARARAARAPPSARAVRHDRRHHLRRRGRALRRLGRLRIVEGRARADRQRARRPRNRSCTSTRSIPATCARRCTRRRSRARTSPTGPNRRPSSPRCCACCTTHRRAVATALPTSRPCRVLGGVVMTTVVVREATEPPEARGITRDAVRMMVAHRADLQIVHAHAHDLPQFLDEGDLVVVNTSGNTRRRARRARRGRHPAGRAPVAATPGRSVARRAAPPERARHGTVVRRPARHHAAARRRRPRPPRDALRDVDPAVGRDPRPPRPGRSPISRCTAARSATATSRATGRSTCTRTCTRANPGSAEMPSAGRPFTPELVTRLVAKGVGVTPLVLHTGVSSLEANEHPYPGVVPRLAFDGGADQRDACATAERSSRSGPPSCARSSRWSTRGASCTRARVGPMWS